jgi:hypothetical protein
LSAARFPPAAERMGGEVGAIGLENDALERDRAEYFHELRVLVGRDAADPQVKTQLRHAQRHRGVAVEGVKNTAELNPFRREYLEGIFCCVPAVDHDRFVFEPREPEHAPEYVALHFAGRMVVVVVEPDFAHAEDARSIEEVLELAFVVGIMLRGVVRVRSHDAEEERVPVHESGRRPRRLPVVADVHDRRHAVLDRAGKHLVEVAGKRGVVQVNV